jgi:hypothetical protein
MQLGLITEGQTAAKGKMNGDRYEEGTYNIALSAACNT